MTDRLTIRRPDDWHLHLRDGALLAAVTPASAAHFGRALVMPNLVPPVARGADAEGYRARILAAIPPGADFTPLMTLYLTETTGAADVAAAAASGLVRAVKLYPAGATTNSASGVRDFDKVRGVLETMADIGLQDIRRDPAAGTVEGVAETFAYGFRDDVIVRIREGRIDMRSASRVGLSDLGYNAERLRKLSKAIKKRLGN